MTWQLKFHDIWDDAREEGLEEGLEEGRKIGLEEGRKEGELEGKIKSLYQLVKKGIITQEMAAEEAEMPMEDFVQRALELQE